MNKELIKKFKAEFDHWLDGGTLLARKWVIDGNDGDSSYTIWYHIDSAFWEAEKIFSTSLEYDKTQFIINDEYVEFRKALAEGKTILFQANPYDYKSWVEHTIEFDNFESDLKYYRIKPNEPRFKAGDWITIEGTLPNDKFKLTEKEIKYSEILLTRFSFIKDTWKHWQPQPGEWVVMTEVNGKAGVYISGFKVCMWNEEDTYDCEPFIGTLPSFLQD